MEVNGVHKLFPESIISKLWARFRFENAIPNKMALGVKMSVRGQLTTRKL